MRELPSVDELLRSEPLKEAVARYSGDLVTVLAREVLASIRSEIIVGGRCSLAIGEAADALLTALAAVTTPSLRSVVNATGTVLHTNLGRSPLAAEAARAVAMAASGPVNIEFDLKKGGRGERDSHVEALLRHLTGAEAACVVNNNAAAVLITLNTLAEGRGVVISRGELIEIGGSFRLPEIIEKSGCVLNEVGTTNRTHPSDYTTAATDGDTALLFKAHTSNYEVVGFTSCVSLRELVKIGGECGLPVVEDLGSGSLADLAPYGMPAEPQVSESVKAGADVVTFSGDKLLGGPQAGLIVGKKEVVDRIRKNPLKRALRVDKLTMAALEATLRLYLEPGRLAERLPALRLLTRSVEEVGAVAERARTFLAAYLGDSCSVSVEDGTSQVGSGALSGHAVATRVVVIKSSGESAESLYGRFLSNDPPIIGRVHKDAFMLDARCVERAEELVPKAPVSKAPIAKAPVSKE